MKPDWRARRRSAAALVVGVLLLLGGCGVVSVWAVRGTEGLIGIARGTDCEPTPELPDRLADDPVLVRPPTMATQAGDPRDWSPCEHGPDGEGRRDGGRTITYRTALIAEDVTRHYEGIAREAGWQLSPGTGAILVRGSRSSGDRCLRLQVAMAPGAERRTFDVRVTFSEPGDRADCAS